MLHPIGKKYIGITSVEPKRRWLSGTGYKNNDYFYKAIKKYGWENIKHKILFTGLSKEDACAKEIELIARYKSDNRKYGYNISSGGLVTSLAPETRKKLSELHKGCLNPMYGKKPRTVFKKGCIPVNKGVPMSEEQKKKLSKLIICVETNTLYYGAREAQRLTGISYSSISNCLRNKSKTAGKMHWEYVI